MVNFWKVLKQNEIPEWDQFYLQYLAGVALIDKIEAESHLNRVVGDQLEQVRGSSINLELNLADADQVPTIQPQKSVPSVSDGDPWLTICGLNTPESPAVEIEFVQFLEAEFLKIYDFFRNQEDVALASFNELNQDLCLQKWRHDEDLATALKVRSKELYRSLDSLRSFRVYNYAGFVKLLKRHRKHSLVSFEDNLLAYLNGSDFVRAHLCVEMRGRLEEMYATAFFDRNMKKGNIDLRGTRVTNADGDFVSFVLGVSVGISAVLFVVFGMTVGLVGRITEQAFFIPVFPIYRGLGMILLLIWVWGMDVLACEKRRINHVFLFKMYHREHLRAVDVFNIAGLLTMIFSIILVCYFALSSPTVVVALKMQYVEPQYFTLCLFIFVLVASLNPFPIFYHTTRFYIIKSMARIIVSPLYPVAFIDFFLGDQLCSLVKVLQDVAYSFCFIFSGAFVHSDGKTCTLFASRAQYVVAFLPFWFRFLQSWRRYFTEGQRERRHLLNVGKYFSSILVTLFSLLQIKGAWIFFSIVATLYNIAWDVKMDWGLLEDGPGWPLRQKLRLEQKWIYYFCAFLDAGMRISWVLTLSPDFIQQDEVVLVLASIEIARRGIHNFFRLENEFLNNCGKFRPVDTTPIPLLPAIVPDLSVHASLPKLASMDSLVFKTLSKQAHNMHERGVHLVGAAKSKMHYEKHKTVPATRSAPASTTPTKPLTNIVTTTATSTATTTSTAIAAATLGPALAAASTATPMLIDTALADPEYAEPTFVDPTFAESTFADFEVKEP